MNESILVPNLFPIKDFNKIAIIGETVSDDEVMLKTPFCGGSGNLLNQVLSKAEIDRNACYLGNVYPYKTNLYRKPPSSESILQDSFTQIRKDLDQLKPNILILLGQEPLTHADPRKSVYTSRGSLFTCLNESSPFFNYKCLTTLHPTTILKNFKDLPLFIFDIKRAKRHSTTKNLVLKQRTFDLDLGVSEICRRLDNWDTSKIATFDLEGGNRELYGGITCMAIAESDTYAFIIDFKSIHDSAKPKLWDSLNAFMSNPNIKKVCQSALYEMFQIPWLWGIQVNGLIGDTMLSGYEIYPELAKSLDTQASIHTDEPYWKDERKIPDDRTHHRYCCKDATVTREIFDVHNEIFQQNPDSFAHYQLNLKITELLSYCQLRGFRYDSEEAEKMKIEGANLQAEYQDKINSQYGKPVNISSPVQMQMMLYEHFKLPKQYEGRGTKRTVSCNAKALLTLIGEYEGEVADLLYNCLKWRKLDGIRKQLDINLDHDGRIRCAYNPVGTETGRFSCYQSNSGSGFNLQTVEPSTKKLFIADKGMYIAKVDLNGADSWTIACHAKSLGESTMFDDLMAGIKPAKVICMSYLLKDPAIATMTQDELSLLCSQVPIEPWLYAASKMTLYGSLYGMREKTMSSNILEQSWKKDGEPVYVKPNICLSLQSHLFKRYKGILAWQNKIEKLLVETGELPSASGHTRRFFGRRNDSATLRSALSHEPQINTSYATSLAASRLHTDPNNRNPDGSYKIEVLHQVHDELVLQFPQDRLEKSIDRIQHYFSNRINISGIDLTIPFSGAVGQHWEDSSIRKL